MTLTSPIAILFLLCVVYAVTDAEECEVCVGFLEHLYKALVASHRELSSALVEEGLMKACAEATGKESRLYLELLHQAQLCSVEDILDFPVMCLAMGLHAGNKDLHECYYLGASSDAAAKVTGEVSRPLSAHVPVQKICQRLQQRDQQICDLRYEQQVLDWSREALLKMRVLELQRVLASWGEECRACVEKNDLIDLIQEVAPKHNAAQPRMQSDEL